MENFTIAPPKTKIYTCYHCGESCQNEIIQFDQKEFCCEGCKLVYDLLRENDLCTYYNLNQNPGQTLKKTNLVSKFEFLDHQQVFNKIIRFKKLQLTFYRHDYLYSKNPSIEKVDLKFLHFH
jgi:Cu+-exporting ATPase